MDFVDSQGSAKMREILSLTEQAGVNLRLARLKPAVREVLARDHVLDRIGDGNIHGNVDHAVEAELAAAGAGWCRRKRGTPLAPLLVMSCCAGGGGCSGHRRRGSGSAVGMVDPAAKHLLQLPQYEPGGEGGGLCQ
jgi:hypothetical protein